MTGNELQGKMTIALGTVVERFRQMEPRQRSRLVAVAGLAVALLWALGWYATRTDWRTLYANLDPGDMREMAAELTSAGIPYDISPNGNALRVPAASLDKARLTTAAKGGPHSGRMGFELFDKPNWAGSEFDEKVNYQRALEGELEQTIDSISSVESSRVHLVLPHDSLFTDDQRAAKASVLLKLRHRDLSSEEAEAIRNLVAGAVDGLHPEEVILADSSGMRLGQKNGDSSAQALEQSLADKVVETIEPVAGVGNVRASVNVEYETSTADEVDETYDPNQSATLSMQRSEQTSGPTPASSGVPGTASNAPNAQPPLYPTKEAAQQSLKQESGTYGVSKRVRHTVEGMGKLRRVTAAVLINDRRTVNGKQIRWQPRSAEEMKEIAGLAQAAIGYDPARGDQVSAENLSFEGNSDQPEQKVADRMLRSISQSESLLRYGSLLVLGLGLFLFVLRPLMRSLPAALAGGAQRAALPVAAVARPVGPTQGAEEVVAERQRLHAQGVFEQISEQLNREPAQGARLIQSWIHTE